MLALFHRKVHVNVFLFHMFFFHIDFQEVFIFVNFLARIVVFLEKTSFSQPIFLSYQI